MMKRMIAVVLAAVLMLMTANGLCEEKAFTIRNGITWGMTKEDVLAIEGETSESASQIEGLSSLFYTDKRVSKYTASMGFIFGNDQLFFIMYGAQTWDENTRAYIGNALSSLYGEAEAGKTEALIAFMQTIVASDYSADDYSDVKTWHAEETTIWFFTYLGTSFIFYIDDSFDFASVNIFDTFGL